MMVIKLFFSFGLKMLASEWVEEINAILTRSFRSHLSFSFRLGDLSLSSLYRCSKKVLCTNFFAVSSFQGLLLITRNLFVQIWNKHKRINCWRLFIWNFPRLRFSFWLGLRMSWVLFGTTEDFRGRFYFPHLT